MQISTMSMASNYYRGHDCDNNSVNSNKALSPQARLQQDASTAFNQLDTKQQGYLTAEDFQQALSQLQNDATSEQSSAWFSQLDSDADGQLTASEFSDAISSMAPSFGPPPPPPGAQGDMATYSRHGRMAEAGAPEGVSVSLEQLTQWQQSLAETDSEAADQLQVLIDQFDVADSDADGVLSLQESGQFWQQQADSTQASKTTQSDGDAMAHTLMQLVKTYGAHSGSLATDTSSLRTSA